MKSTLNKFIVAGATTAMLLATSALAADGDVKIQGFISGHTGNVIRVRPSDGSAPQVVTLSPTTEVKQVDGALGVQKKDAPQSALIPGLAVKIEATPAGTGFNATKVEFKGGDLKDAQRIAAGAAPVQRQADATAAAEAANRDQLNNLGTAESLATAEVLFASGKTAISAQGKSDLQAFAAKAKGVKGYQITVLGFTDSTGNAAQNQALSKARANAVIQYLQQHTGVQPGRVRSGDAMGVAPDAGSGSNANARKVVVRLVTDKGFTQN